MLVAFAPWIPRVRDRLPTTRRIRQIEGFWRAGWVLRHKTLSTEAEFAEWKESQAKWHRQTSKWLQQNISVVEAARFGAPVVQPLTFSHAVNNQHNQTINLLDRQLAELIRIRDEQQAKLR